MLRRLGRTLVICHPQIVVCNLKCREVPKKKILYTFYMTRHEHANSVKLGKTGKKADFLTMYPTAQKYRGTFSSKVQPFSINAPTLYVHNFINKLGHSLEIPYVYEDGYSAAMCLEKICNICDKDSDLTTVVSRNMSPEEWHEVNLAVDDEIPYLDERTLVSLISVSYRVKGFNKSCFDKIYKRFSRILSRRKNITVTELCRWSNILCQNKNLEQDYIQLFKRIWSMIESRFGTVASDELVYLYKAIPTKYNHLFETFYNDFKRNLPSLGAHEVCVIGRELQKKSDRTMEFQLVVGWIKENLDSVSAEELQSLLSNFTAAGYFNEHLFKILSQYSVNRQLIGKHVDHDFMQIFLQYCTISTFYDPDILEIACDMYLNSTREYTYDELAVLLRAIGVLNYIPENASNFFYKVESYIMREALLMRPDQLLDLVTYLLYVDRPLFNLKEFIFSASFQGLVLDLQEKEAETYRQCLKQIYLFSQACCEVYYFPFPFLKIKEKDLFQRLTPWGYKMKTLYSDMVDFLELHIPKNKMMHVPRPTFDETYIQLQFDVNGELIDIPNSDTENSYRYRKGIFLISDSAYCKTYRSFVSHHMLGSEMVNIRVLENQNMEVVLIHKRQLVEARRKSEARKLVAELRKPDENKFSKWKMNLSKKLDHDNSEMSDESEEVEDVERDSTNKQFKRGIK